MSEVLRRDPVRLLARRVRRAKERGGWVLERTSTADRLRAWRQRRARRAWQGGGSPPHLVKEALVKEYAQRFGLETLIETGSLYGDMVQATRRAFSRIVSIELAPHLAVRTAERFAPLRHVTILEGDSARLLPVVLAELEQPALFWLDGHFSAGNTARGSTDTPIREELAAIQTHALLGHVILIDDARAFGRGGYPSLDEVRTLVHPSLAFEVKDDIIRICPPTSLAG